MRELIDQRVRHRRFVVGGLLAGAFAIGVLAAAPGNGLATPPVDPTAPTCAEGGVCAVGDTGPGGGTVFFVKGSGAFAASRFFPDLSQDCVRWHDCFENTPEATLTSEAQAALPFDYLEVAPAAGEAIRAWSITQEVVADAMHSAIGSGASNTAAMLVTLGALGYDTATTSAAYYARSYSGAGLTDWFLPSVDELSLILIEQAELGAQMGTFDPNQWSSTDCCGNSARALSFSNGQDLYVTKNAGLIGVRPVRAFSVTVQPTTTTTTTASTTTTTIAPTTTTIAPTVTEPATTEPATTQPETTQPETTQPETTHPETTHPETTVPVTATPTAGDPGPLTEQAVLRMPLESVGAPTLIGREGQVTVSADGLVAGDPVAVYVASEPVLVGSGFAAPDGSFSMAITLPAGLLGEHSLVIHQPTTGLSVRQAIQIVSQELPRTGSNSTLLEAIAIMLLLGGFGCVLGARRRAGAIAMRRLESRDDAQRAG